MGLKKENKALAAELGSVNEQLSEGGKSSVELEKLRRKLTTENEELTLALEEAEGALEQEEAKFLKVQLELTQLKQSSDRKIAEKEEEAEASRKNHQRQLESLQATIEAELRSKGELQKNRKKFESDILELEGQLESASRISGESQKTIKKLQAQIKELQGLLDDEGRSKDEARDSISRAERRANASLFNSTKLVSLWNKPTVPENSPKMNAPNIWIVWASYKHYTTTPPTENEKQKETSMLYKKRSKNSRTRLKQLTRRQPRP